MIIALLLATAPVASARPMSAIDAELAFARDAKRIGQWTAFRKWADRDAVMFTPQAVWAQSFLKPLKDPPKTVTWGPTQSFVSCDGRTAVNTGPWFKGLDGTQGGYFTTVWQHTGRNWRWVYDGGGPVAPNTSVKTGKPAARVASCKTKAPGAPISAPPPLSAKEARTTPEDEGRGQSADKTLGWEWKVAKDGSRTLRVYQWNGRRYVTALSNDVPAQPTK